jgi:hypothetical protein
MTSNTTGNPPSLAVAGGDTNIQMQLQGKGNLGAAVQGRTDGNNSSAGYLGQIITSSVAFASAITLVSGTVANITSISLTAGNWMLVGNVYVNNSSSGLETVYGGINTASATMPDQSTLAGFGGTALSLINEFGGNIGAVTFLTATTTYYLVVFSAFTLGTSKGCGYITAIRIS